MFYNSDMPSICSVVDVYQKKKKNGQSRFFFFLGSIPAGKGIRRKWDPPAAES